MARVEHDFPLSRADLAGLTPANLLALSQEEVDQLYGRLTAGPIPDGPYLGDLFFPRGDDLRPRLEEILGGLEGRIAAEKIELAESGRPRALEGQDVLPRRARRCGTSSRTSARSSGLIDDPDALDRPTVPREGWLRHILPTTDVWLLFPAKLHCGQSLLDGRRESVIIDYAYNDDLPGYQERPDALVGRNGLRIRDEIRMIRPGFYLGRAYANKIFLLNFMLLNDDVAEAGLGRLRRWRRGGRGLLDRRTATARRRLTLALPRGDGGARPRRAAAPPTRNSSPAPASAPTCRRRRLAARRRLPRRPPLPLRGGPRPPPRAGRPRERRDRADPARPLAAAVRRRTRTSSPRPALVVAVTGDTAAGPATRASPTASSSATSPRPR